MAYKTVKVTVRFTKDNLDKVDKIVNQNGGDRSKYIRNVVMGAVDAELKRPVDGSDTKILAWMDRCAYKWVRGTYKQSVQKIDEIKLKS